MKPVGKIFIVICGVGFTITLLIGSIFLESSQREKQEKYCEKIAECQQLINRMDRETLILRGKIARMNDSGRRSKQYLFINEQQPNWADLLKFIVQCLPEDVWLNKLLINETQGEQHVLKIFNHQGNRNKSKKSYHIVLCARCVSKESMNLFTDKFTKNDFLKNISVENKGNTDFAWRFEVECELEQW